MSNAIIDYKFIRNVCKEYGESKNYVTMKMVGKKLGITKPEVIKIIQYAIINNIIPDELIKKIIAKVTNNDYNNKYPHSLEETYNEYLKKREKNKGNFDKCYNSYLANITRLEHMIDISHDFSDGDEFDYTKENLEYSLKCAYDALSRYENYLYNKFFSAV